MAEIENPCFHCYTGAIGYCSEIGCKYKDEPWSGDLDAEIVEIEKKNVKKMNDLIDRNLVLHETEKACTVKKINCSQHNYLS